MGSCGKVGGIGGGSKRGTGTRPLEPTTNYAHNRADLGQAEAAEQKDVKEQSLHFQKREMKPAEKLWTGHLPNPSSPVFESSPVTSSS